jgi:voltage-gated potassium channel
MIGNEKLKKKIYEIVFEAETPAGRIFDLTLLISIFLSVIVVMIETIPEVRASYHDELVAVEWVFSVLFCIEYGLRIYSVQKPMKYITSFYGVIDFLSILPAFVLLFFSGAQSLMILRALRLLRVFRILKLTRYIAQGQLIMKALRASREKLLVFVVFIMILVIIFGSLMYFIEGHINEGLDSIPRSIYWAIVTLTTVGYGDISPITPLGQFLASIIMISGYAIIAVPTGIVTGEIITASKLKDQPRFNTNTCPNCLLEGHEMDAKYCRNCGGEL